MKLLHFQLTRSHRPFDESKAKLKRSFCIKRGRQRFAASVEVSTVQCEEEGIVTIVSLHYFT